MRVYLRMILEKCQNNPHNIVGGVAFWKKVYEATKSNNDGHKVIGKDPAL